MPISREEGSTEDRERKEEVRRKRREGSWRGEEEKQGKALQRASGQAGAAGKGVSKPTECQAVHSTRPAAPLHVI